MTLLLIFFAALTGYLFVGLVRILCDVLTEYDQPE